MPRRLVTLARIVLVALAVLGVLVVANLGAGAQETADGREVFAAHCVICHGELGRGVPDQGPPLVGVGAASVDFMIRTGRMPLDGPDVRLQRRAQQITDAEREALIDYIEGLSDEPGPGIPDVDPTRGDLAHGRELFTNNCAACHGPTGAGIAVGQRDIAPALDDATPLEIAEAIRTGPGVMPVFGADVYEQQDLDSVVAWVLDLRQRETPGGATIGRSGPVFEGTIAWLIGIGGLLGVAYLLGERARDEADGEADGEAGEGSGDGQAG